MIDLKQLVTVEHISYFGSTITNDEKWTREMKSRISMAKAPFNRKNTCFTSIKNLNLRKKLVKCYILSIAFYGSEKWTFRKVDQTFLEILIISNSFLEGFQILCWVRMKVSWTDRVRNEEVIHVVCKE
jgi:hypothetical protein